MRRLLPLLALLLLPPAAAADDDALADLLAWNELTPADLQVDWRDTVDRGSASVDPTRVASADQLLDSPLLAPTWAANVGEALRPAPGAGIAWRGFFALAAAELGVELVDPCGEPDSVSGGLVTASVTYEAEQGVRRSRREIKGLEESVDPRLDAILGRLSKQADGVRCTLTASVLEPLPEEARAAVVAQLGRLLGDLLPGTTEAQEVAAGLANAWAKVDQGGLLAAGQSWSDTIAAATHELSSLPTDAWPATPQIWPTALGEVWIGSTGANSGSGDPFLIVDPGGDDQWRVLSGRTDLPPSGARAVRGWIDLAGDDLWQTGAAGVGGALFSVSAGVDLAGDDTWRGGSLTAGAAAFGVATWVDIAGEDHYQAGPASEGFAAFGAAALVDRGDGDDSYRSPGPAQGAGLPAGVGVLHDVAGDDSFDVGEGGGQGTSRGLFPQLGGGLGLLLDHAGDDSRHTRGPGQGACDGHGVGAAIDLGGDDVWTSSALGSQGAGLQECAGLLVSLGSGSDRFDALGSAQGWAEDRGVGVLWDDGGHDQYAVAFGGQGGAGWGGTGLLVDVAGADVYVTGTGPRAMSRGGISIGLLADLDDKLDTFEWQRPRGGLGGLGAAIAAPADGPAAVALVRDHAGQPSEAASALEKAGPGVLAAVLATVSADRPAEAEVVHRYIARGAGATSAEQRRAIAQTIAADALGRDQSAGDASVARHLTWLASLASRYVETTEEAVRVAKALRDHPSWRVRSKALYVFRSVLTNPQLEVSDVDRAEWEGYGAVALQNDADPEVRWAAADLLERAGGPGVATILAQSMKVGDAALRFRTEEALVAIAQRTDGLGVARATFPLADGGDGISLPVRAAALRVLGTTGHREAWDVLEPALADADPRIRRAAAYGAGYLLPNRKVEAGIRGRLEVEQEPRVRIDLLGVGR